MAYTINLTDGTIFATVDAGTVNNASSMTLIGKNYAGYGQFLDNNFIHLLENSADTTAPSAPLTGQLWWDKTNALLKVYTGVAFKSISAATSSTTAPTNNVIGDFWYDTVNQQLKVWTGAAFLVIGPAFTSAEGISGAIPETINDSSATPHDVTSLYVDNERVAVVSKDANFTPAAPTVTTFPTIYTGITLTNSGSPVFAGSATNAQLLDSLDSTDFMRATANTSTTGTVKVLNNTGLFVGSANVFNVNISSNDARIKSDISTGNLIIQANVGGTTYDVATALGSNGTFAVSNAITVGTTAVVTGNITGGNLITAGLITVTGNITGGNVLGGANVNATTHTGTTVSVTGNVTGGNLITAGLITATGNITGGNITTGAQVSATGNITGGNITTGAQVSATGNISGGNLIAVGGVTGTTVTTASITKTGTNAIGNIGSSINYFNQIFATATTALYADVAERFAADETYLPGTVVELGGPAEITSARRALSDDVFGVISTRAAYLMNGGAGTDATHPPVAITGRVPVRVIGAIRRGDRLVAAGDGLARAAAPGEATAFNTIGRALGQKTDPGNGVIEAIVTIK